MKNLRQVEPHTVPISPSEGYRLWSRTYDTDPNPILALERRVVGERLGNIAGKRLVDVGCGTGRWMTFAIQGGARAVGADLCVEMLEVARGKPSLDGTLVQADCCLLPFRDAVADIAVCSFTIGYASDPSRTIGELARIAKPGGTVVVTDLHPGTRSRGWRRTFRYGELILELTARQIDREQLLEYGRTAGLEVLRVCEPHMGEPESVLMQQAGKGDRFGEVAAIPAILCIEWERA